MNFVPQNRFCTTKFSISRVLYHKYGEFCTTNNYVPRYFVPQSIVLYHKKKGFVPQNEQTDRETENESDKSADK